MTEQPKSWRDVIKVHPAADLFPMMAPDELKALGEDIRKHGLTHKVVMWSSEKSEDVFLLDGRNRLDAIEQLGIQVVDRRGRLSLNTDITNLAFPDYAETSDPYAYVLSANVHRRQLTAEQKREIIAAVLKAQPSKSNRTIAKQTDHKTVGAVREKLEAGGEIPHHDVHEDSRGTKQPAHKPAKKKRRDVEDYIAEKKARRAEREIELAQRITALPQKQFVVVYADPAWRFEPYSRETGMDRAADNHYPTMTTAEISTMDIASIIATDSILFLWATVPMLPQAIDVMKAWGFAYKSHIVWDKGRAGTGFWVRNRHEILLIGTRGEIPAPAPGTQSESLISAPAGVHSAKPLCFAEMIERLYPTVPKIELFRRGTARPGWDAWGNEVPVLSADGAPTESPESGETFRYVRHDDVAMFESEGWQATPALAGTHHGEYSCLMRKGV